MKTMMMMDKDKLAEMLERHSLWLHGLDGGKKADLSGADLRKVELYGADLREVNLCYANLRGADLRMANMKGAALLKVNLRGANLQKAALRGAKLNYAALFGAKLNHADLCEADLFGADLRKADLRGANLDYSCWPIWCGSLSIRIDAKIAAQLLYHALRAMEGVEDDEVRAVRNNPANIELANRFHRVGECGRLKEV